MNYLILFTFIISAIAVYERIKDLLKFRKKHNKQIIKSHNFDPDCWMSIQKHTKFTEIDEERLERRIKFDSENGLIPKNSLLYYIINKRNKCQRIGESKEQLVIRLMKKDFKQNNGIDFDEFMNIRDNIVKNNPEKLI